MIKRALTAFAVIATVTLANSAAWSEPKDIRWGTGPVGSSGHKALVVLANLLNKEMPDYRISVLPLPGAVMTVKGYATGEYEGYYGSDIALEEFANDSGRFKGFKAKMKRAPVQSFWSYTLDVGVAIKASNKDKIKKWTDLTGKKVYTGPLPFDTRLKLERALAAVGAKHIYTQVDLSTAGSQLESRRHRRHDHLYRRRYPAGAVDLAGFTRRRLGRAQPECRRDRDTEQEGLQLHQCEGDGLQARRARARRQAVSGLLGV